MAKMEEADVLAIMVAIMSTKYGLEATTAKNLVAWAKAIRYMIRKG